MWLTPTYRWYQTNIVSGFKNDVWLGIVGVDCHHDLHFGWRQSRKQATHLVRQVRHRGALGKVDG